MRLKMAGFSPNRSVGLRLFESLEERRLLTATPELVVDVNTAPQAVGNSALLETNDDQVIWLQAIATDKTEVHLVTESSNEADSATLVATLDGHLATSFVDDKKVVFSLSNGSNRDVWSTDGTKDGTFQLTSHEGFRQVTTAASLQLVESSDETFSLWWTNVGPNTKLADFGKLTFKDFIGEPQTVGETVFFRIQRTNSEIWATDGTPEGTRQISTARAPHGLVGFQDQLIFKASDEIGPQLWKVDASAADSEPVTQTNGEPLLWATAYAANDEMLFGTTKRTSGELAYDYWVADSSLELQKPFKTFSTAPTDVNVVGSLFEFTAAGARWQTDGTAEGTVQVVSSVPIPVWAAPREFNLDGQHIELVREGNSRLLRIANDVGDSVLLKADLDLNAKFIDDEDGMVFFATNDELWSTDGTEAGTQFVTQLPVQSSFVSKGVVADNALVIFDRYDVWAGDLSAGLQLRIDNTTTVDDQIRWFANLGETHFFTNRATTGGGEVSIWAVQGNGDAEEILRVEDGQSLSHSSVNSSLITKADPQGAVVVDSLYFLFQVSTNEQLLMRTQGTAESTEGVASLPTGRVTFEAVGDYLTMFVYQRSEDGGWSSADGTQLWVSDGTTEGTSMIAEGVAHYDSFIDGERRPEAFGDKLYFPTTNEECSGCLSSFDPATESITTVTLPDGVQRVEGLRAIDDRLYFTGLQEDNKLFFLDSNEQVRTTEIEMLSGGFNIVFGNLQGQYAVVDIRRGGEKYVQVTDGTDSRRFAIPWLSKVVMIGDKVHYTARNEVGQYEFYSTDGTPEGTQLYFTDIVEIERQENGVRIRQVPDSVINVTGAGSHVYLQTRNAIWKSDGTPNGTIQIATLDEPEPSTFRFGQTGPMVVSEDQLLFTTTGPTSGVALHRVPINPEPLAGDIDQDFDVDFADFLALADNFGKEADAVFEEGDLNGDGAVDFDDFLLLSEHFGEDLKRPIS